MNQRELSKYLASIGSKGGKARAKSLSKKRQRAIALKASKAASKERRARKKSRRSRRKTITVSRPATHA